MMKAFLLLSILYPLIICIDDYYIGAVVEYAPIDIEDIEVPLEVMISNIDRYLAFMAEANVSGADIIVFPEYGVTGTIVSEMKDRVKAREFMVVGEVGRNYCQDEYVNNNDEVLEMVACGAVDFNMYVVINIGEIVNCTLAQIECSHEDGFNFFNTNLVFDRSGTLVAKYWKQNLYFEPVFDVPAEPVFTCFTSDFGVNFGTFTCFDVLWEQSVQLLQECPNVTDIVFPTSWVDDIPFFVAPVVQNGWAVTNSVNFLASGRHHPQTLALGSGIFSPNGPLNYTYDENSGSRLVTAKVPILKNHEKETKMDDPKNAYQTNFNSRYYEDISKFTKVEMTKGKSEILELCHNGTFCCQASYNISNTNNASYIMIAYDGLRQMAIPGQFFSVQTCGVLVCNIRDHENLDDCEIPEPGTVEGETFDYLTLSSSNFNSSSLILPSLLDPTGQLPDWTKIQYSREDDVTRLDLVNTDLFSAALYARILDLDN